MKFTTITLTLAAAGTIAAAQPHHQHRHRHHVKRVPEAEVVSGPTVYSYEFEGEQISEEKVCEGIADGTLEWADGTPPPSACSDNSDSEESETEAPRKDAQFFEKPDDINQMNVQSTQEPEPTSTSSVAEEPTTYAAPAPTQGGNGGNGGNGVHSEFPDGELSCDEFPSDYGAVPAPWLKLGGWTGVQFVTIAEKQISDIRTAITGQTCGEGAMCSYACPAGYQKSQWPTTQGSTGQSVGGLECRGGKLYLTNKALSNKLCVEGNGGVNVKNTLGQGVAVCRTDYPGKP